MSNPIAKRTEKTDQEWKRILNPERFHVMREKGTEPAFTGEYFDTKEEGVYQCAACGTALFPSDTKFESGTGWPSFWAPVAENSIATETDRSHGMTRTEVLCNTCHSHLGHLFPDGPEPTGLRYCLNSVALELVEPE